MDKELRKKIIKTKLTEEQDLRRKLTAADREEIRELRADGNMTIEEIAAEFNVCASTIKNTLNPKRCREVARKSRRKRYKAHREQLLKESEISRKKREQRKIELYEKGELKIDE